MDYIKKIKLFNNKYSHELLLVLIINFFATCNIFLFNEDIKKQLLFTIFILFFYFEASSYPINRKITIFITYCIFAFTLLIAENIIIQISNKKTLSYNAYTLQNLKIGPFKINVPIWLLSAYFSMSLVMITTYNILEI
tara:strand:- start:1729 stop:2142 length:414 start_codon:yes stop_codon:yes gene_type:complete